MKKNFFYLILACFFIGCEKESQTINDTASPNKATYQMTSKTEVTDAGVLAHRFECLGETYDSAVHTFEQVDNDVLCDDDIPFYITGTTNFPVNNNSLVELEVKINPDHRFIQGITDIDWTIINTPISGPVASFNMLVGATFSPIQCNIQWAARNCIDETTLVFDLKLSNQLSSPDTHLEGSKACIGLTCYALEIVNGTYFDCPNYRLSLDGISNLPINPNARDSGTIGGGAFAVIVP